MNKYFERKEVFNKIQKKFIKALMSEIKEWDVWWFEPFDEYTFVSPEFGYVIHPQMNIMGELIDTENSMMELGHVKIGSL